MRIQDAKVNPVTAIAGAAVFGALASLITILLGPVLQPSFPVLIYLKFDFAEVIDLLAFLIFGPVAGVLTAAVHGVILSFAPGGTGSFGASLKFLAVITTFLGVSLASKLGKHSIRRTGLAMTLSGTVTRITLMTVVNYIYLVTIAQVLFGITDFIPYAQFLLSQVGLNVSGSILILYILGLTAAFNAVHAIFTIVVSTIVAGILLRRAPQLLQSRAWIANFAEFSFGKGQRAVEAKESSGPD